MTRKTIYLDNAASTRIHPDVLDAMLPFLKEEYGNPSSIHKSGRLARRAVEDARKRVASLINADPSEIFFTSGGTESNNAALYMVRAAGRNCRIITSSIEHDAILEPCRQLASDGLATVEYIPVNGAGIVDKGRLADLLKEEVSDMRQGASEPADVAALASAPDGHVQRTRGPEPGPPAHARPPIWPWLGQVRPRGPEPGPPAHARPSAPHTCLVSIMFANNEVGTVQPIKAIARLCRKAGVLFHTDAVQAVGKLLVDVQVTKVDMMSLSSHKIHGPKGVGALYVRKGVCLPAMMLGGGQEMGMRSGTENVAGIVGFGAACRITQEYLIDNMLYTKKLRDRLAGRVLAEIPYSTMNGDVRARLPGNAHFTFLGVSGEDLLIKLDEHGVAASTGSACSVHTQKASHVLQAMGLSHEQIAGSLRLTVDSFNTVKDVDRVVEILKHVVQELRTVSPFRTKYSFGGPVGS